MTSTSNRAGILFDLDETLIDRAGSICAYASLLWSEHAQKLDVTQAVFIDHFVELDGNGYVPRPDFFRALAEAYPQTGLDADELKFAMAHLQNEFALLSEQESGEGVDGC